MPGAGGGRSWRFEGSPGVWGAVIATVHRAARLRAKMLELASKNGHSFDILVKPMPPFESQHPTVPETEQRNDQLPV